MAADVPAEFEIETPDAARFIVGQDEAESALLNACKSGRVHHAWLIDGPEGIGKATLAYRFARYLLSHSDLGAASVQDARDLSVPADDSIARQIRAKAHPDLIVLQRPRDEEGRATATVISVDAVRRVARFLSTTSATGGWRVVIVDSADDFNRSSANALLKMLEEPPQKAVFLLLSSASGRLLPTIRSRCRRLTLKPLDVETVVDMLRHSGVGSDDEARETAAALSGGSLGRAIGLASDESVETIHAVHTILSDIPRHDPVAGQRLAESLGRRGAEDRYRVAGALIVDWIAAKMREEARSGADPRVLAPWPEVWEKVTHALSEAERLNLDRTLTLLSVFRIVSAAASNDVARV
jgi:DNA polymerase III subunit delta'